MNDHSDFRADPWRRLRGTLRSYLAIVFGSTPAARAEIRRLEALHRGIVGPGYAASDPVLALWVHATLVDATLVANDAWLGPLDPATRAAFYEETRPIGRAFGIPDELLPDDIDAFDAYVERMLAPDGPVDVGDLARDLAGVILHPPLPGALGSLPVPAACYDWTLWPASGCCPTRSARRTAFRGTRGIGRVAALARRRLASVASVDPGRVPADAAGPGRGRADAWRGASRSSGSAARRAFGRGPSRSRRRGPGAVPWSCSGRSGGRPRTRAWPPRTPSSPSSCGPAR